MKGRRVKERELTQLEFDGYPVVNGIITGGEYKGWSPGLAYFDRECNRRIKERKMKEVFEKIGKMAALYEWTQSELTDQDKEFIEQMKASLGQFTKIKILEELLDYYKKQAAMIVEQKIPDEMAATGVTEVTVDGYKISLQQYYSFKKEEKAIDWLFSNGFAEIVKSDIVISGALPETIVDTIEKLGIEYNVKQDVHHMTLTSVLSEYVRNGGVVPTDAFKVNAFTKAKISRR